jgi:hypothetical protein
MTMYKKTIILSILTAIILLVSLPTIAGAWTTYHLNTVQIGDYLWKNYDFTTTSYGASSTKVDWPISVIFWGEDDEVVTVDGAKNLLWDCSTAGILHAYYSDDGSNWHWDDDKGRKSACNDDDAWHCRVYADTGEDQCTHYLWDYYVVGTSHRDYKDYPAYEYHGDTNDASDAVTAKAAETVGAGNIDDYFVYLCNYEIWRREGASEPYHVWDNDGWAEGINMD